MDRNAMATGLIVTVITVLIWVWAANETKESVPMTVSVEFVTDDAHLLKPERTTVSVEMLGSKRSLREAEERLTTLELAQSSLEIGEGEAQPIELRPLLQNHPSFAELGLTLLSCKPAAIEAELIRLVTIPATVRARPPARFQTTGEIVIEPATVDVRLPAGLWEQVRLQSGELVAEATISRDMVAQLEPGRTQVLTAVPLRLPQIQDLTDVRTTPASVDVRLTPASQTRTSTVDLVPVQIAGIDRDLGAYTVQIEEDDAFLRNVEVTGPDDLIRRIDAGEVTVYAFVHFRTDDLERNVTEKPVSFFSPSGITVRLPGLGEGEMPLIGITIGKEEAPE